MIDKLPSPQILSEMGIWDLIKEFSDISNPLARLEHIITVLEDAANSTEISDDIVDLLLEKIDLFKALLERLRDEKEHSLSRVANKLTDKKASMTILRKTAQKLMAKYGQQMDPVIERSLEKARSSIARLLVSDTRYQDNLSVAIGLRWTGQDASGGWHGTLDVPIYMKNENSPYIAQDFIRQIEAMNLSSLFPADFNLNVWARTEQQPVVGSKPVQPIEMGTPRTRIPQLSQAPWISTLQPQPQSTVDIGAELSKRYGPSGTNAPMVTQPSTGTPDLSAMMDPAVWTPEQVSPEARQQELQGMRRRWYTNKQTGQRVLGTPPK